EAGELVGTGEDVRQSLALVGAEAVGRLVTAGNRFDGINPGIDGANQGKLLGQYLPCRKLRTHADEVRPPIEFFFKLSQIQLAAAFRQGRFQNLVLWSDRAAFKDMTETVREGIIRPDPFPEIFGLTIGGTGDFS